MAEEGIFPHKCIEEDCDTIVQYDDEPWCFTHSPDEGSSLVGWSAQKALTESAMENIVHKVNNRNIFENNENRENGGN